MKQEQAKAQLIQHYSAVLKEASSLLGQRLPSNAQNNQQCFLRGTANDKGNMVKVRLRQQGQVFNFMKDCPQYYRGKMIETSQGALAHGQGQYLYQNGLSYKGEWAYGQKQGFGVLSGLLQDSDQLYYDVFLQAKWRDNCLVQKCHAVFSHSKYGKYQGQLQSGKRNGTGSFLYSNGQIFTGQFELNHKTRGAYFFDNGDIYEGSFQMGKFKGQADYHSARLGAVLRGEFSGTSFKGSLISKQSNNTLFTGTIQFSKDFRKEVWQGQLYLGAGITISGTFIDGIVEQGSLKLQDKLIHLQWQANMPVL